MAGSRLDRIGTIFSRTTGLIKAGAVKYQDRPIWYDVYRVFPPKYEPHIDRVAETKTVTDLLYPEDRYRARFFRKFGRNPGGIARNLGDRNFEEPSQPFVNICLELMKRNGDWSETQIFDAAMERYKPNLPSVGDEERRSFKRERDGGEERERDRLQEVISEKIASRREGRKTPTITAQSLLSLFKEAKEQQQQEKPDAETKISDEKIRGTDEQKKK